MFKSYKQMKICKFSIFQHVGNFHDFLSQKLETFCKTHCMGKSWKILFRMRYNFSLNDTLYLCNFSLLLYHDHPKQICSTRTSFYHIALTQHHAGERRGAAARCTRLLFSRETLVRVECAARLQHLILLTFYIRKCFVFQSVYFRE